jgi:hypothetical protein
MNSIGDEFWQPLAATENELEEKVHARNRCSNSKNDLQKLKNLLIN